GCPSFVLERVTVLRSRRPVWIASASSSRGWVTAVYSPRSGSPPTPRWSESRPNPHWSAEELGWRLSRPQDWARANWIPFDRFRGLDRVRTVHGTLTGLDLSSRTVGVRHDDGSTSAEGYDALVISTGVTNGFWRRPNFQSANEIGADLRASHGRLAEAGSVMVVGGGAAAVSSAANVARTWPGKRV